MWCDGMWCDVMWCDGRLPSSLCVPLPCSHVLLSLCFAVVLVGCRKWQCRLALAALVRDKNESINLCFVWFDRKWFCAMCENDVCQRIATAADLMQPRNAIVDVSRERSRWWDLSSALSLIMSLDSIASDTCCPAVTLSQNSIEAVCVWSQVWTLKWLRLDSMWCIVVVKYQLLDLEWLTMPMIQMVVQHSLYINVPPVRRHHITIRSAFHHRLTARTN